MTDDGYPPEGEPWPPFKPPLPRELAASLVALFFLAMACLGVASYLHLQLDAEPSMGSTGCDTLKAMAREDAVRQRGLGSVLLGDVGERMAQARILAESAMRELHGHPRQPAVRLLWEQLAALEQSFKAEQTACALPATTSPSAEGASR